MSKYSVKLNGQTLVQNLDYQTAVRIASQMNGENITQFGDKSIKQTGANLYEASISSR